MNNIETAKVQPQGAPYHLLDFPSQFQPGFAYESVTYKKKRVLG